MSRRVAFLIGNQTFRTDSELLPLRGPVNDVAALSRLFRDPARGNFEVCEFLNEPHHVILPEIEQALGSAVPGDLFLIYYSGHGKLDRNGRLCLATADTRKGALSATSIPARHLRDLVEDSDCDQVLLLLDCCYSGAVDDGLRGDLSSELELVKNASGFYIITASSGIQVARETELMPGGAVMGRFTAALVRGIESGAADRARKGMILMSDLRPYLEDVVTGQAPQFFARRATGDPIISFSPASSSSNLVSDGDTPGTGETAQRVAPTETLADKEAKRLRRRGHKLLILGQLPQAIAVYDDLVARAGLSTELPVLRQVAEALREKSQALGSLDRTEEQFGIYETMIARFGTSTDPWLHALVSMARLKMGAELERLGRSDDALAAYDAVVDHFDNRSKGLVLMEHFDNVAQALCNKVILLDSLGRRAEALVGCESLVARFGTSKQRYLSERVTWANEYKRSLIKRLL